MMIVDDLYQGMLDPDHEENVEDQDDADALEVIAHMFDDGEVMLDSQKKKEQKRLR